MLRGLVALLLLLATATLASAAEEILLFRSDVTVEPNGDFVVTETIRVNAEGKEIKRGIYRDFPVQFVKADGSIGQNAFELVSATRDGLAETTRTERRSNFIRVYLGQEDVFLQPGVYTYELKFRTDRQVRFFDDHDEVYWNATGTEWIFPIRKAVATVDLPDGATAQDTVAYTGAYGSTAQNARATVSQGGNVVTFETTQPLGPREGLTVAVAFQKGIIAPPPREREILWFLRDNSASLIAVAGLLVVTAYYLWAWVRVGRDPPRGVVVPRWDLPEDMSPALVHYIWNKGLARMGFPALSAAAVNLAVKGYLELDEIGKTITLRRTGKPKDGAAFPVGEKALLDKLDALGGTLEISKANGKTVQALGRRFTSAIESEHKSVFYRHNVGWIVPGVILSVGTLVLTLAFGRLSENTIGFVIMSLFVSIFVTAFLLAIAKAAARGLAGKIRLAVLLVMAVVILLNSGLLAATGWYKFIEQPLVIGALAAIAMVNALLFFLMGAPTRLGQQRTVEIEGLRRYLTVAEKDRMNMAGAPEMSPQHFERLLPYAMALGVEKPWSDAFQKWLRAAAAAGVAAAAAYHGPSWYRGRSGFDSNRIGRTMGGLSNSMAKSFTSSLPATKSSSSGFSGGSSGGGGGGGGGGGW
ncbi:DUF2207 domain-containing protein [Oricola thermophila]|uniref:DUF2207 domain-containing protein n=1 Tax=Oricola thermophila TaxID=2742145 RepID=A0A6N1VDJ3_9HYPH|nr:DUF2207 domain-containing protein [Oricola thermophila]QKV18914.1 DUF2207 domain-containing protein [Oricola thermophila]